MLGIVAKKLASNGKSKNENDVLAKILESIKK